MSGPDESDFQVLIVCKANHCRSPLAEHLLRAELGYRDLPWTVSSAGTRARPGQPMHPSAARILAGRDIDARTWTSRRLTAEMVQRADLVLTADEEQRGTIARLVPTALPRSFTLLQFGYLSASVPPPASTGAEYGRQLLERVQEVRGFMQPLRRPERDLPDPMGQSYLKFRRCAGAVERAVDEMLSGAPIRDWRWPSTATA